MSSWWILVPATILVAVAVELVARSLVTYLRSDFQWLITSSDESPIMDPVALKKFILHGFDSELGWVRKPNTTGTESTRSVGAIPRHHERVSYRIDQFGRRANPGHEQLPAVISTYGDSFAFCRHVNDDATWQWYLSELTQTNILNFGVGNYGLDQAFLRLKREYRHARTEVVIIAVVPETIVRILGVWRHYFEYGNTFAFKPRFVANGTGVSLIPNFIDSEEKFRDLVRYLPEIQQFDYFYRNRFKRHVLTFPYATSILRSGTRNLPLIWALMVRKAYERMGKRYDRPWELVLEQNKTDCIKLYRQEAAVGLMLRIVREFARYAEEEHFTPLFVLMPYQTDIEYIRRTGISYFQHFVNEVSKIVPTLDMTAKLLTVDEQLYTNDFYGGHLNARGNELVAQSLFAKLRHERDTLKLGAQAYPRL